MCMNTKLVLLGMAMQTTKRRVRHVDNQAPKVIKQANTRSQERHAYLI